MVFTRTMTASSTTLPVDPDSPWLEAPGIGKALARGVAVGIVISFLGVGAVLLAAGQSIGAALAMGAFVAIWGGLGFGGMVGGVVWANRLEQQAAHDRPLAPAAPTEAADPLRPAP